MRRRSLLRSWEGNKLKQFKQGYVYESTPWAKLSPTPPIRRTFPRYVALALFLSALIIYGIK